MLLYVNSKKLVFNTKRGGRMKAIGTRVSEKTYDQLTTLAQEQGVTLGNFLRQMADYFCQHQLDLREPVYQGKDHLCHMVEQIHAALPHLMLYSRATYANAVEPLNEQKYNQLLESSLQKITEICGGFQGVHYQMTLTSCSPKGIKTIPIDPHKSTWR